MSNRRLQTTSLSQLGAGALAWAWRDDSFPHGWPRNAAAGTPHQAVGAYSLCYTALMSCPDVPRPVGMGTFYLHLCCLMLLCPPVYTAPRGTTCHSVPLHRSRFSLGSAGCACRGMCECQDKTAKTQHDLQSQGRKKAHPPTCAALPSGASTQLRPSFLQCNFAGGSAYPPPGLAGPVPAPAAAPSAAAPAEKLSPESWSLDSTNGWPVASWKGVMRP